MAESRKRALLIGPNYAPDLPYDVVGPLEGVQNDLKLMEGMLHGNGFQRHDIKVLEGDNATFVNILESLKDLASIAESGSVVVIYFSGHGYQLEDEFDEGLLPAGLTREMVDKYHIYDVCITGEHFKPHLYKLIKKGCLVNTIFDCCFSGRLYRGFVDKDGPSLNPKQLKLSKEYIRKYCEILKAKGVPVEHGEPYPTDRLSNAVQEEEGNKSEHDVPYQETQPPSPMDQQTLLQYPAQEFFNKMWKSQGWRPAEHDKFIHIGACAANERGYEVTKVGSPGGCLTTALVEAINEAKGKRISYGILKSLIKQKFSEKNWTGQQTPQFEGGNLDMVLFSFDIVPHLKGFEISKTDVGSEKVHLNAGKLHGVVDGDYYVFSPEATSEDVSRVRMDRNRLYMIDRIVINREDIWPLQSHGTIVEKSNTQSKIQVGWKAVLLNRNSIFTPVVINAPPEITPEQRKRMPEAICGQDMFTLAEEEKPDSIILDIKIVEDKQCWRARRNGKMIAPYQEVGDEYLMAKNLSKYFRHQFAILPEPADDEMLTHVSFKIFKVEKVQSFRGAPDKKVALIANAVKTLPDLSEGPTPVFKAHKVALGTSMYYLKRYRVVDGTGDALVIEVTNNEEKPIHICLISYQADGSIVVLYPPKKGQTEVLRPGESARTIKRVLLEPDTVRRMVEPDFDKDKPKRCNDVIILYATTEESDYEPLTQTPIELSYKLSTRSPNPPDNISLAVVSRFREALKPRRDEQCARDAPAKWLTMRREITIEYNEDP